MSTTTTSIVSVGEAARELALSVNGVLKAAERAGVKPELTIDRVPYFAADDVERIDAAVKRERH